MPIRSGRSGGGSRGARPSVSTRTTRSSSTGSRGFRINLGNRAPRSSVDLPDTANPNPTGYRPYTRRGMLSPSGGAGGRLIGIIVGAILLGLCACVGLTLVLQALGYGG